MRIKFIRLGITVAFIAVGCGLFYTQLLQGGYFFELSVNNRIRLVPLQGQRGQIQDRNGVVLADNRLAFNVSIVPQEVQGGEREERLFDFLSNILKVNKKKLMQVYQQRRVAPFAPVTVAEGVDKTMAMVLEESKFQFPGLYIEESLKRVYPFQAIGAHVLGYVGKINPDKMEKLGEYGYTFESIIGKSGVEEYYDAFLKGTTGGQQIEVNSRGQQVRLLSIRDATPGKDIQLTIDERIQELAANLLAGRKGSILVMDQGNGEILGMVNFPSYDPNVFLDSGNKNVGTLFIDPTAPLLNRAIQGLYPPGSVFKAIVTIGGLLTGKIDLHTSFYCDGAFHLGRKLFHCAHVHGTQDWLQGITHSCNVYFFNVGQLIGPEVMDKYARLMGLGDLTKIDLPYEEKGSVPSPMQRAMKSKRGWYKGDTLNYAIGQGDLLVTPVQLLRMMATIARSGQEVQPHLLKAINGEDIVNVATPRTIPIDPGIFKTLQRGFRSVVEDPTGTARTLEIAGLDISGKTGTAQSMGNKDSHAWFVGYNREGRSKIVFCVFLEYGGSSYNAVVLAKELLTQMKAMEIL